MSSPHALAVLHFANGVEARVENLVAGVQKPNRAGTCWAPKVALVKEGVDPQEKGHDRWQYRRG